MALTLLLVHVTMWQFTPSRLTLRLRPAIARWLLLRGRIGRYAILAISLGLSPLASGVYVSADGSGQALIFPYYTVRSTDGNFYNTYISIANQSSDTKALRVRVRSGWESAEAASFNLFLSPGDMWTSAIVPTSTAARLVSQDRSCTSPPFTSSPGEAPGIGLVDGFLMDRAREGSIEVLEMGVLVGASAALVLQTPGGEPANCAGVQGAASLDIGAPTGGLTGTLTLINVSSGLDFTAPAEALAELASRHYYRPAADPYPDLGVAEVDPVSVVVANGFIYRSTWARPVDAVSATLMRSGWSLEYVLDPATRSRTDFVVTYPTRPHYVSATTTVQPPFAQDCTGSGAGAQTELVEVRYFNREAGGAPYLDGRLLGFACRGSVTLDIKSTPPLVDTAVLGSKSRAMLSILVPESFTNGWLRFGLPRARSLTSLPTSSRVNIATGVTTSGSHTYTGLPMTGFWVRTFENGSLTCSSGTCQGNYGGLFPLTYTRTITPAN